MQHIQHNKVITDYSPRRIVCLTEETTETLYLLGEQERIVGVSGFTERPPEARREKPVISTFINARYQEIVDLNPDLVIGFSDIQADIARKLISKGISVWINNHRSVEGIQKMIMQVGALVGQAEKARKLLEDLNLRINEIQRVTSTWEVKPKVYFEEWYDPMISGIQWVSELVEIAGGEDIFPENRNQSLATNRIIEKPEEIVKRNPDIILASWCGAPYDKNHILKRENFQSITAVQNNDIYEIDSSVILQPGPAALTDGLNQLFHIFNNWKRKTG